MRKMGQDLFETHSTQKILSQWGVKHAECPRSHTSVLNVYETSALKKAPNNENGVQNNGRCTPSAIQFMSDQM